MRKGTDIYLAKSVFAALSFVIIASCGPTSNIAKMDRRIHRLGTTKSDSLFQKICCVPLPPFGNSAEGYFKNGEIALVVVSKNEGNHRVDGRFYILNNHFAKVVWRETIIEENGAVNDTLYTSVDRSLQHYKKETPAGTGTEKDLVLRERLLTLASNLIIALDSLYQKNRKP